MTEHIETPQEEHVVYEFFLASVLLKGFISIAEVIAAVAVFFIPPTLIVSLALSILTYVPIASVQEALMREVAHYTEGAVVFVAFYLFSRGIIKVVLIAGLLKNKLIAYPLSLIVFALLIVYQCYQIATQHSLIVVGITLFDLVVMYFVYREWKIVLRHRGLVGVFTLRKVTPEQRS